MGFHDPRLEAGGLAKLVAILGESDILSDTESVRAAAQRLGLNLGRVIRGSVLDHQWQSVVMAVDGEGKLDDLLEDLLGTLGDGSSASALRAWCEGESRRSTSQPGPSQSRCDIRIESRLWLDDLGRSSGIKIPERLLRADYRPLDQPPFRELTELVRKALAIPAIVIGIGLASRPDDMICVSSVPQFCAVILADLVLQHDDPGPKRWLMKETVKIRGRNRPEELQQLSAVWACIYDNFVARDPVTAGQTPISRFAEACLENATNLTPKQFYSQLRTLLTLSQEDPELTMALRQSLEVFRDQPDQELSSDFFIELNRLIGDAAGTYRRAVGTAPPFRPRLTSVGATDRWRYNFETMRVPLTAGEASSLDPIFDSQSNLNMPFLFTSPMEFRTLSEFYRNLSREITTILRLVSRLETDAEAAWDVPNLTEWIRMSGCERQRFPWGNEFDTIERANLKVADREARIHPVGSYPKGASSHGILDCCGNVYQLVRISQGDNIKENFRLVGQSYLTPAETASCRHVGRFFPIRGETDRRQNVGLRLIRYRRKDAGIRWNDPIGAHAGDHWMDPLV